MFFRVRQHWIARIVLLILCAAQTVYAAPPFQKNVLIINSYHQGFAWSDAEMSGIIERLRSVYPEADVPVEFLDAKRHPARADLHIAEKFFLEKYRDKKIDLIIVLDNPALDMLIRYRNELFPEVPAVFAGISNFDRAMLADRKQITGIIEKQDVKNTLELALALHPKTREVLVVNDNTMSGTAALKDVEKLLPHFEERVNLKILPPSTFEEARAAIAALPPAAIVLIHSFSTDRQGNTASLSESTRLFASAATVPVYATHETRLGHGIIGGFMLSGKEHGHRAADLALRILSGESPDTIPVEQEGSSKLMFDFLQLQRFGILQEKLPRGTILVNAPESFFEKNKKLVIGTVAVLIVLVSLVLWLITAIVRRKRTEDSLRASKAFLDSVLEHSPYSTWVADNTGTLIKSNQVLRDVLHVADKDLLGKYNVFQDEMVREQGLMPLIKQVFEQQKTVRFTMQYDTSRIPGSKNKPAQPLLLDITMSPVLDDQNRLLNVIVQHVDITEQKRVEQTLREKSEELDRIFNLSLDLLCVASFDGRLIKLNPAWEQTLGYRLDELEGRKFMDFVHPDDVSSTMQATAELAAGRDIIDFTNRYRCRDGSYRWIEWCSKPFQNDLIYAAARDVTARKQADDILRENEAKFRKILEALPLPIVTGTDAGEIEYVNPKFVETFGYSQEDVPTLDAWFQLAYPDPDYREYLKKMLAAAIKRVAEGGPPIQGYEVYIRCKDGSVKTVEVCGGPFGYHSMRIYNDITSRKQAEKEQEKLREQLFQTQKMETVGMLAGGVAHDFNNLLTPVLGYSEILMRGLPADDPRRVKLEYIKQAADLARGLIKRLLAFGRKQMLELAAVHVGNLVRDFEQVLHRTIRENIQIKINFPPSLGLVHADRGQIEQVLLNLAINAQDAMPEGGVLCIEAGDVELDAAYTSTHPEVDPGPYVMLSVSDTGTGMDEETMKHIFDPFFTTKELDRGTGLGLSTVYGIVKQHGGSISVYSEKGHGSIFKIFLPRILANETETVAQPLLKDETSQGDETVLVAEDNASVRTLARGMLESLGYHVLSAGSVDHCIETAKSYPGTIDLLLTDVIMPKMNGKDLYEFLKRDRHGLKVLFMSGYTNNVIAHHGILDEDINFLQKPFTMTSLSQKVRKVLES